MVSEHSELCEAGILARLQRRKVVQWSVVYTAGAWGLLQGVAYMVDTFAWPRPIQQVATLAALVGLPIVIVVAWFHGDRGQQRVSGTEFAILTLLFAVGGMIFWQYQFATDEASFAATSARTGGVREASVAESRPSIAVLPFDNRSDERKDAYFVDGIHDDILTQLTKVSAMRVISRTSVEQFRDTRLTSREIAAKLGVTKVLKGGVQRAGDRVRITVQLIDAATDAHLWAESYDRQLTVANIFAIQSEVAAAVASALRAELTPAELARATSVPTGNLEAWEAFQLGRQRQAHRTSESLAQAAAYFQTAIDLDPAFASAYAGLAENALLQVDHTGQAREPGIARAERLVAKALQLDPNLVEAVTLVAGLADAREDFARAEAGYVKAIALNPNYATAHHWYSTMLTTVGRYEESLKFAEQARQLDPMSAVVNLNLGGARELLGRFDEALLSYRRAVEIDPDMALAYQKIGQLYVFALGRTDEGLPWCETAVRLDPTNPYRIINLAILHLQLAGGHDAEARRVLEKALQQGLPAANNGMVLYFMNRGELAEARPYAEKAHAADARNWLAVGALRILDLREGNPEVARERYARSFPELFDNEAVITGFNYVAAIDAAQVLLTLGETDRAAQLLDRAEQFIRAKRRMGSEGFGIADVQILVLRGRTADALAALRQAERDGWRLGWRFFRDVDPTLAAIRDESEFKAIFGDIERDMAAQRARVDARRDDITRERAGSGELDVET